jgi:hypothetical protein
MKRRMSIPELWQQVRLRDNRHTAKRARLRGRLGQDARDQRIFVELVDRDGHRYSAEIVKALTASQRTVTTHHGRSKQTPRETSQLVPDGFKVLTIGGTCVLDSRGAGTAYLHDHTGARTRSLDLRIAQPAVVDVRVHGQVTVHRLDNETLGSIVRIAASRDSELRAQVEAALDRHRDLL